MRSSRPDRSGRRVMTRRNRRPDRRRVKALRSYTIDEVARTLEVHRNTVLTLDQGWAAYHRRQASDPDPGRRSCRVSLAAARGPATAVPGRADVLPEVPQAAGAGGPDGGLRGEFCHLGKDNLGAPHVLLWCAAIRDDRLKPEAICSRDVDDNSCSHNESLNCFGRFGKRPNESDH